MTRRERREHRWLALSALVLTVLVGCDLVRPVGTAPAAPEPTLTAAVTAAEAALPGLTVTDGPREPYNRDKHFGSGWTNPRGPECDARQVALARQITNPVRDPRDPCKILRGDFHDPYTGRTVPDVETKYLDGDHIVSLKDAYESGAWTWSATRRKKFANNPANVVVATEAANGGKQARGPATWNPATHAATCWWVAEYVTIKDREGLGITAADKKAAAATLAGCKTP